MEYGLVLQDWNQIRDRNNAEEKKPLEIEQLGDRKDFIDKFFSMLTS